jgi:hypothetical protein
VYPEKYTQLIVSIKIKGYKVSVIGFNPIVRPPSIADFNARHHALKPSPSASTP